MEAPLEKMLLVLVGLPARGKSYVANKTRSFLRWRGVQCESFNVGAARRKAVKTDTPQTAEFFASNNAAAKAQREALAMAVLHSALDWLEVAGGVAILDATNTTRSRRLHVLQSIAEYGQLKDCDPPYVVFVECICNEPSVLRSNMLQKVTNSPDYAEMDVEAALADLHARIVEYEKVYEPVDDAEDESSPLGPISYIKLIDLQSKVVCRHIFGQTAFAIVSFLMVVHIGLRPIWLVRAGQCTDDLVRKALITNAEHAAAAAGRGGDAADNSTPATAASSVAGTSTMPTPLRPTATTSSLYPGSAAHSLATLSSTMASTALSAGERRVAAAARTCTPMCVLLVE